MQHGPEKLQPTDHTPEAGSHKMIGRVGKARECNDFIDSAPSLCLS